MVDVISDDAFVRLFQERVGLKVDGWAGRDTIAKLDEFFPPKFSTGEIAIPDDYWPMLSKIDPARREPQALILRPRHLAA